MARKYNRFMARKYTGRTTMPGKAYVYDYDAGGIARIDGKLAWYPTLAAAQRVAATLNRGGGGAARPR